MPEIWRFWRWLFFGLESKQSGIGRVWDRWLVLHIAVALAVSLTLPVPIETAAKTILLPLAGLLIGLSFAWAGNAQVLMQEQEIIDLSEYHPDGIENYIYTFQMAILIILVTLVLWGLAGLEFLNLVEQYCSSSARFVFECVLIFFASLTIRECWHVVLGSQLLMLSRLKIRKARKSTREAEAGKAAE